MEKLGDIYNADFFSEWGPSNADYVRSAELVTGAINKIFKPASVADLGCGTGLCGPLLRSTARRLVGVDLSGEMLARARARAVYDELIETDIVSMLRGAPGGFDLIISADTLVYFGDLTEVVAAVADALRPGGAVAFTVEARSDPPGDATFEIQPSGRYRHHPDYVRKTLSNHGLAFITLSPAELRREKGVLVEGLVCCAQRAPAD